MDYLLFNTFALAAFAVTILFAFCAGVLIPTFAKAGVSGFGRLFGFVRKRAGHFASFVAGGALVAMFTMTTTPYYLYSLSNMYEAAEVGAVIIDNETILETGQIPDHVLTWYHRSFGDEAND